MNVDTGTFAAISAESAMLRKHAERAGARPAPAPAQAWHAAAA